MSHFKSITSNLLRAPTNNQPTTAATATAALAVRESLGSATHNTSSTTKHRDSRCSVALPSPRTKCLVAPRRIQTTIWDIKSGTALNTATCMTYAATSTTLSGAGPLYPSPLPVPHLGNVFDVC